MAVTGWQGVSMLLDVGGSGNRNISMEDKARPAVETVVGLLEDLKAIVETVQGDHDHVAMVVLVLVHAPRLRDLPGSADGAISAGRR